MAMAQSCGVRFAAAFQMPPRVTEIPVVAAAAVETGGAVLASTGGAECPQDVVGARVEPERGLELADRGRLPSRAQVREPELVAQVDLPRLLAYGGPKRRVCSPRT